MIASPPITPTVSHSITPSKRKYGEFILQNGFTQHARAVEDYLNTLDLCSTERLLVLVLETYYWQEGQEVFPSVETLALRCGVHRRRMNQLTSLMVAKGLILKRERFSKKRQLSNYYDLAPLYERVAAWKNAGIAAALAEREALADTPFEPRTELERAAQLISEGFDESTPRRLRDTVERLEKRRTYCPHLPWEDFLNLAAEAARQTKQRQAEPTHSGRAFVKLLPYFFSALDYQLSRALSPATATRTPQAPVPVGTHPATPSSQTALSKGPQQPAKKTGPLAERAQARKEAEAAGRAKVRPPETLALHIRATAATFNDDHEKSSVQRAANLMADADLDEQTMLDLVAEARAATSQRGHIQARNKHGKINRMPYFFQLLEASMIRLLTKQTE